MLNFPPQPNWRYDSQKIGKITVLPSVEFEIDVHTEPNFYPRWKYYNVGCYLFGCTCGIQFKTPQEVTAYIERQKAKVPEYAKLGAKRDAIDNRMKPLRKKWEENSNALFKLAESPRH